MIRTLITPTETNINLSIPEDYIGKKIEVLMFTVEEITIESHVSGTSLKPSQLRGFLSNDTAEMLHNHIHKSRSEWNTL